MNTSIILAVIVAIGGIRLILSPTPFRNDTKHTKESQIKFSRYSGILSILMAAFICYLGFADKENGTYPLIGKVDMNVAIAVDIAALVIFIAAFIAGYMLILKKTDDAQSGTKSKEDEDF